MAFTKKKQTRITIMAVIAVVVLLLYVMRICSLQIVNARTYVAQGDGISTIVSKIKAPRGEILDCYGRQIAINRDGYNVVFNSASIKRSELNDTILRLIKIFKEKNAKWEDSLPISHTEPHTYTGEEGEKKRLIKTLNLADYATAQNCFVQMVKRYSLENFTKSEQRLIMGVRYSMEITDFSVTNPYVFAQDITPELMRVISEYNFTLNGVTVNITPFREYVDTTLAPNIIGELGPIYAEEWEELKKKGYSYNDRVGKSGIEAYAEADLRGIDGEITYRIDSKGTIIETMVTKEPVPGKTVMLTLDKTIQRAAQDALKNVITKAQSNVGQQGSRVVGGAAVAVDVKTNEIIVSANYPSFDMATYHEIYDSLAANPAKPLTDRAFNGIYPVGSTIKPVVALAALENGLVTSSEHIYCKHTYVYFSDYRPSCMGWHGNTDLTKALSLSCNYYFFELGKRIGIMKLTDYFKQFGLGVNPNTEVSASSGLLVEPTNDNMGGDTLQASIGQMNAFTPLQLASYTATLANGGTRNQASLISKTVSYDLSKTYHENEGKQLNKIKINPKNLEDIKKGMLSVTTDGTGSWVFGNYPLKVGGKTGTSQTTSGADHCVFIAFAPYDHPEIAIAVVAEHGEISSTAASVAKAIMDAYFFADENDKTFQKPYVVLE